VNVAIKMDETEHIHLMRERRVKNLFYPINYLSKLDTAAPNWLTGWKLMIAKPIGAFFFDSPG